MKKTLFVAGASLAASLLSLSAVAHADDSPIQLDAYALAVNTPSCDAKIVVNGNVESHTTGSQSNCATFKGASSTISIADLKQGPINLALHNADSHTVKTYDATVTPHDYQNILGQLDNYKHKSLTFNYPYKAGSASCNDAGETQDIFTTPHHEQVEICFSGYN